MLNKEKITKALILIIACALPIFALSIYGSVSASAASFPPAGAGKLKGPLMEAFNSKGDMWVANGSGNTIVEFAPSQLAASGNPAPKVVLSSNSSGSIVFPHGIAFDKNGDLWVANANGAKSTIVEFTPSQLAASGDPAPAVILSADGSGSSIKMPIGIAFDKKGDLWADNGGISTIVEFTPSQLAASGDPAPAVILSADGSGSIDGPRGIAFNSNGDLWAVNFMNNTIVEFTPSQLAASGNPAPKVVLSANAGKSLNKPVTVAFDKKGNLWADNTAPGDNTAVEFTPSRLVTGNPVPNAIIADASGTAAPLNGPRGIAFDSNGNLWVINFGNNNIVEFNSTRLSTIPAGETAMLKASVTIN